MGRTTTPERRGPGSERGRLVGPLKREKKKIKISNRCRGKQASMSLHGIKKEIWYF